MNNPVGFQDKLYKDEVIIRHLRYRSYSEMIGTNALKSAAPKICLVDDDENTGGKNVLYFWDGVNLNIISQTTNPAAKADLWVVETKAAADLFVVDLTNYAEIVVLEDETNNGQTTKYFWNKIALQEYLLL